VDCEPQRVTALVDDALEGEERAALDAHLTGCEECRAQLEEEHHIRASLRGLPAPEPTFGLEQRVRRRLRGRGRLSAAVRLLLPLAAVLMVALWARGYAPFVAWELARDHTHCFGMDRLPAEILASEPEIVTAWFDEQGTNLPLVPPAVGRLALVGGRFCRLPDASRAAHLYYASDHDQVSVFLVSHDVRMSDEHAAHVGGHTVALVRLGSSVLGVVGDDENQVGAFVSRLRTSVAALGSGAGPILTTPSPSS
jgi:anti-sigma factor RsiW